MPVESALARKLNIDRRTVKKYIDGFEKSKTRNRPSSIDRHRKDAPGHHYRI